MNRICIFCGSNYGLRPIYAETARRVGKALAARGIGLVYGGGRVGLMGEIANSVIEAGGETIGVMPDALFNKELGHTGLSELHVVGSMHDRKGMMAELSDAFITLPGGFGTMEEFFEVLTWGQLGLHRKPCGLLNIDGYFNPLLSLCESFVTEKFARPEHLEFIIADEDIDSLLDRLERYEAPVLRKWIADDDT